MSAAELSRTLTYKPVFEDAGKVDGVVGGTWQVDPPDLQSTLQPHPTLAPYTLKTTLSQRWQTVARAEGWGSEPPSTSNPTPLETTASKKSSKRTAGKKADPPVDARTDFASPLQMDLFGKMRSFRDILYTAREKPPPASKHHGHGKASAKGVDGMDAVMDAYLLHALEHVITTQKLVMKNNERLKKQRAAAVEKGEGGEPEIPRDQGFTRPKVFTNSRRAIVRRCIMMEGVAEHPR